MDLSYHDYVKPYSLASRRALYNAVRNQGFSEKDVKHYLSTQLAYTLHKPVIRKFRRRRYVVKGLNDLVQIDLADVSSLSRFNRGIKYILVWIDCLSRYLKVATLKDKSGPSVAAAISKLIGSNPPTHVQSDKGREFLNPQVQDLFRQHDVNFYTTQDPDTKAAFAERVIRSLKGKIYRYMTAVKNKRYIDKLEELVLSYNRRKHRTIGMAPIDVNESNASQLLDRLYPANDRNVDFTFSQGQPVRIALEKSVFAKGYTPNWSKEVFFITDQLPTDPATYKIKDEQGERILGSYYRQELQSVQHETPPGESSRP